MSFLRRSTSNQIRYAVVIVIILFAFYRLYQKSPAFLSDHSSTVQYAKPILPLRTRDSIGAYLENEGFTKGAELGVQQGIFSDQTLTTWPSCEKYYLVDVWRQQKNYDDGANVDDSKQEKLFEETQKRLEAYKDKTVFIRKFTSEAVHQIQDGELDYVYVDARHDYCGCMQDLELYWPKVRAGGIFAGHDYKTAAERPGKDWGLCQDGTRNEGAVRGAVDDFAAKHDLQVVVTYRDDWNSWMIRKPIMRRV